MIKRIGQKIIAGILTAVLIAGSLNGISGYAEDNTLSEKEQSEEMSFQGENPVTAENYREVDAKGNVNQAKEESGIVEEDVSFYAATPQIVNFNTKSSGQTTDYTEEETGVAGYTYGPYAADAAYLGKTSSGKVRFMLAGVIGTVNAREVQIVNKSSAKSLSYYYVSNNRLYHKIATNINNAGSGSTLDNGPAPSYLKTGVNYYSYDGHYFYTESNFGNMIDDYNNKTRSHSVNPNNPFYNYFQYLPLRSQSGYNESSFNTLLNNKVTSTSKMRNTGDDFVKNQNAYGANALLMAGIAANESAWGTSNIAKTKNNLFGLNAVDSSPGESANYFESVSQCIKEYGEKWLSKEYLNPQNWKHYGAFLGNKASGMNVKYASDPYWGEKAAAMAWLLDGNGGNKDAYKYTIGIKDTIYPSNVVNVRKESTTSSTAFYKTKKNANCSFLILDKNPVNKFYKIQSEPVLNSGRTGINSSSGVYNFSNMYAYLSSDYLKIVSEGKTTWSVNGIDTDLSSPQLFDTSIKVSANISGNKTGLQYKFVWQKNDWSEWGVLKDFSSTDYATWLPKSEGNYTILLDVKDTSGKVITVSIPYQIKNWSYSGVKTSIQSPSALKTQINLSADIKGTTSGLQYKFVWQKDNWKEWGVIQELSSKNTAEWTPKKSGTYTVYVDVKDSDGVTTSYPKIFTIKNTGEITIQLQPNTNQNVGGKVNIKALVGGSNNNTKYKFVWQKDNWKEWGVIQDLSTKNNVDWIPKKEGTYTICVDVKQGNASAETKTIQVKVGKWTYNEISVNKNQNGELEIKPIIQGNTTGFTYKYVWQKNNWKEWGVIKDFSGQEKMSWKPNGKGQYTMVVDVKDAAGNVKTVSKVFNIQ